MFVRLFFCNKLITLETHPLCKFVLHLSFYICNSHLLSTILWVYSRLSCVPGINLLWFYFLAIKFPPECVHVQRTTTFCRWLPQFYHHTATYSGCCIHRLILNTTRHAVFTWGIFWNSIKKSSCISVEQMSVAFYTFDKLSLSTLTTGCL